MGLFDGFKHVKSSHGKIILSTDEIQDEEKKENLSEIEVCNFFINKLKDEKDVSKFKIEHLSNNYTTLKYDVFDVLRVKFTLKAKWISVAPTNEDRDIYKDSPLFDDQGNKNQVHWKSYINSINDLEKYLDIVRHSCRVYVKETVLDEREAPIFEHFKNELVKRGLKEDLIEFNKTSEHTYIYYCGAYAVYIKLYKKKKNLFTAGHNQLVIDIAEKSGLPVNKYGQMEFDTLEELQTESMDKFLTGIIPWFKEMEEYQRSK